MLVFIWGQGSQFDERTAKSEINLKYTLKTSVHQKPSHIKDILYQKCGKPKAKPFM